MAKRASRNADSAGVPPPRDAFICYARSEPTELAMRIQQALQEVGKHAYIDLEMPGGLEWERHLHREITRANAFIFVVSREALKSKWCREELAFAERQNKLIIPVISQNADELPADALAPVEHLQFVYLRPTDDWASGFFKLVGALEADIAWREDHARLSDRMRDWELGGRRRGQLLRAGELSKWRLWLADHERHLQKATNEQTEYIAFSHRAARLRRRVLAAAGMTLLLACAIAVTVIVNLSSGERAARDEAQANHIMALANDIGAEIKTLAPTQPALASQLALEATRISPTPTTRTQLLNAAADPLPREPILPGLDDRAIAFSPDGRTLAVIASNIWLWNTTDASQPAELGAPVTIPGSDFFTAAFSPKGQTLAAGTDSGTMYLWNIADRGGIELRQPPLHGTGGIIQALAFSPDGRTVVDGTYAGRVYFWNISDPRKPTLLGHLAVGRQGYVSSVAFSPDGRSLAAGTSAGVWLWNTATPRKPTFLSRVLSGGGPQGEVSSVAFSPAGSTLAAATYDGKVWLWNTHDPRRPHQLLGQPLTGPVNEFDSLAFGPDGKTLAAGSDDDKVFLWNTSNPGDPTRLGQPLPGPAGDVSSIAFSSNGQTLATSGDKQGVILWSLPTTTLRGPTAPITSIAFSPNGRRIAVASEEYGTDGSVSLWSAPQGTTMTPLMSDATISSNAVAFSQGSTIFAAGTNANGVWLWEGPRPDRRTQLAQPPQDDTNGADYSVAITPNGHALAAGGTNDGLVWLWSTTNPDHPTELGRLPQSVASGANSLAFSPDGQTLAVGDGNGDVWLWSAQHPGSATELAHPPSTTNRNGAEGTASSVAFDPHGHTIAAASDDTGAVWLWNTSRPDNPIQLSKPESGSTVAFSLDGHILAVGSPNGTVTLMDTTNPARPTELGAPLTGPTGGVTALAFSPDGDTLAAGGADGTVRMWSLAMDDAVERICSTTAYALTRNLWTQYVPQLAYSPPCAHVGHDGRLGS